MAPVSLQVTEGRPERIENLTTWLDSIELPEAWQADPADCRPDVVIGDGSLIGAMMTLERPPVTIDIELPTTGTIDVLPKKLVGAEGALTLLERIINGLYQQC